MKLQDAYASESNKVGTWTLIGYVAPGAASAGATGTTTNFTYTGSIAAETAIGEFQGGNGWTASNNSALNECAIGTGNWNIAVAANTNGNSLSYTASTACPQLTPSFDKIGQ